MILDKKVFLYDRDEEGKLIPKKVDLIKPLGDFTEIYATPLCRGERLRIAASGLNDAGDTTTDTDLDIVLEHTWTPGELSKPLFTREELDASPIEFVEIISLTILKESGLNVDKKDEKKKFEKLNKEIESDFPKVSESQEEEPKKET